jgi:lipoic acid synthetase
MNSYETQDGRKRLPLWLKRGVIDPDETRVVRKILKKYNLNTVCEGARCPNKGECYAQQTATFMILGNTCTRNCLFCSVEYEEHPSLDEKEPQNVAKAIEELGLKYVVITSVTRDDLPDGGAGHFEQTVKLIRQLKKDVAIEVLVPDFRGSYNAVRQVLDAGVNVFNHNVETIQTLYPKARPQAQYEISLDILRYAKQYKPDVLTKSGLMIGLGETTDQLQVLFEDLKSHNVDIITIGQYIQPTKKSLPVEKYYTEEEFVDIKKLAKTKDLNVVVAGPLVRSSYKAFESYAKFS